MSRRFKIERLTTALSSYYQIIKLVANFLTHNLQLLPYYLTLLYSKKIFLSIQKAHTHTQTA
jgi:hypothetical protein